MLYNIRDIVCKTKQWGMLPFFKGEIEDFSIEELITPDCWFQDNDGGYGVWDWKNDIILDADCAYGKFYRGRACFVSMEWFPELMNWRRSQYKPSANEEALLAIVQEHNSLLTREMKKLCGYSTRPPKRKGFDTATTHLQMGCRLISANFEYSYARDGHRYGWSVARMCTPEDFFGAERLKPHCTPQESRIRLMEHLHSILPHATERQIERFVDL